MKRKIIRVGSSRGILLPREVTRAMNWGFGSEIDLNMNKEKKELVLSTIKVKIPEEYNIDIMGIINEILNKNVDILGGIND